MEILCKDLRDRAMKIINYEKKEMIPLTNEEKKYYKSKKIVVYAKKNLVLIKIMKKNLNYTIKSEIMTIIQENLEEQLIIFVI